MRLGTFAFVLLLFSDGRASEAEDQVSKLIAKLDDSENCTTRAVAGHELARLALFDQRAVSQAIPTLLWIKFDRGRARSNGCADLLKEADSALGILGHTKDTISGYMLALQSPKTPIYDEAVRILYEYVSTASADAVNDIELFPTAIEFLLKRTPTVNQQWFLIDTLRQYVQKTDREVPKELIEYLVSVSYTPGRTSTLAGNVLCSFGSGALLALARSLHAHPPSQAVLFIIGHGWQATTNASEIQRKAIIGEILPELDKALRLPAVFDNCTIHCAAAFVAGKIGRPAIGLRPLLQKIADEPYYSRGVQSCAELAARDALISLGPAP